MIYRAYIGREQVNEFRVNGKNLEELRGGETIFWKKQKNKKGTRIPAHCFETKILCGETAIGYFTDYLAGTKSLEVCDTQKPYIKTLHTWKTHEKIDEAGKENNYTRYVLSNEFGGIVYVMDFTWYKPDDEIRDQVAYINNFFVIENGEIKESYTYENRKMYFPPYTFMGTAAAKPAYFYNKDGDFHFLVIWTQKIDEEERTVQAQHLVFRKGQIISQDEFFTTGVFDICLEDNESQLMVTYTAPYLNHVRLVTTKDKKGKGAVYHLDDNTGATSVIDVNGGTGKFENRLFLTDVYGNCLYEYLDGEDTPLIRSASQEITGVFKAWRLALYKGVIYVANNESVYEFGNVDDATGTAKKIYEPEFKSGSKPQISGIIVESDTLFTFYKKGTKYYMDAIPLDEIGKGDTA